MNYGELITNIKALAFEEDETIDEYIENDVIPTSINRAISMIGNDVLPIVKKYVIEQDGDESEYLYYDFTRLVDDFLDFDANPVRIDDGDVYKAFGDYQIETGDTIVIDGSIAGTFRVFYKASHTPYDPNADMDEVEIPLKPKVHHLVPLLASYYVWLDDDSTKAAQYYNAYETDASAVIAELEKPRMRVNTEMWGNSKSNAFPLVTDMSEWRW